MAQQERTLPRLWAELERTPAADVEHFKEAVRPLLQPLARHVRREMAFLRARGDLEGDFPAAGDVVDETAPPEPSEPADESLEQAFDRVGREAIQAGCRPSQTTEAPR